MSQPFRRACRNAQRPLSRAPLLLIPKQTLAISVATIALLALAVPAVAEFLGPDRLTTQLVTVRDPDNDVWTLTHVDPDDGFFDVCLIIHTCDEHPSVERQQALCGWVADNSGCTLAYKTGEQPVLLQEATISGVLQNCTLIDGWCTTQPTLHLVGVEPLAYANITLIEGTRNGLAFACSSATCDVPLLQGTNQFTFWALSSYGDSSQMGTFSAAVDSLAPSVSIPDTWFIWEPVAIGVDDAGVGAAQASLTIDGGSYGQRKYTWGNLSLVPDDFVWDRHFGEIIAPIGEYPVAVTATDALGNAATSIGEIVIPNPGESEGETGLSEVSFAEGSSNGASSGEPFLLDELLALLPDDDAGIAAADPSSILSGAEGTSSSTSASDSESGTSPGTGELSTTDSLTGTEPSTVSTGGPSGALLWGAAALAAAASATAYGLSRRSVRLDKIEAQRREASRTSSPEARRSRLSSLWTQAQARVAPIRRAMIAAAAAATAAAEAARQRAADALRERNERLLAEREERLEQAYRRQALLASQAPASEQPLDMAKLKQQDYAAYEASQQAEAYQEFQAQERASISVVAPSPVASWWQRTVDNFQQAQRSVANWVDQHQAAVAIGVGVVAGVAGVATIVLSGGTATPLVVAGWAALAAGGTVALGTVGLNAYNGRPLTQNLLRNSALSVGGAVATVGGFTLLTGGVATQAALGVGNAVAGLCLRFQPACARLEPVLQAFDTGEQLWLSAQLAVQTATKDPRAPETALELQLEYMDGGVPGNTAIRKLQGEISEAAARHGDEVLTAAAGVVNRYGDDAVRLIERHGDAGIAFLAAHEDDAMVLVARHGDDIVTAFGRYGDEGVTVAEQYGLDFIRRSEKLGTDPTNILSNPPTQAQTPEGWLLGITESRNPVNQPLKLNLPDEEIARIAESSVHNQDSPLFAIGFSSRVEVPYDELGKQHGIGFFSAADEVYRPFRDTDALGDFWRVNSQAIEGAMADRKIFVLNVPFSDVGDASRSSSSTLAELNLIITGDYVVRRVGDHDMLIPSELLDRYRSIIEGAAPDLLAP